MLLDFFCCKCKARFGTSNLDSVTCPKCNYKFTKEELNADKKYIEEFREMLKKNNEIIIRNKDNILE